MREIDESTSQITPWEQAGGDDGPAAGNGHALARRTAQTDIASTRAAQEVQAAMVIAKKFPRDQQQAFRSIMQACQRRSLAESAVYEYPRGGEKVSGPSIRLAEVLAQNWGNLDFGVVELEQRRGESQVMAYCWDLETNVRQTKVFTVKHERHTRRGISELNDPRDIYEMAANQGARRLRACILGVIPGDVVDAAVQECEKTMIGKNQEPLADRVRKMLSYFAEMGVTQVQLEEKFGCKADAFTERQLSRAKKWIVSIRDGVTTVEELFPLAAGEKAADPKKTDAAALAAKISQAPAATQPAQSAVESTATQPPAQESQQAPSAAPSQASPDEPPANAPSVFSDPAMAERTCRDAAMEMTGADGLKITRQIFNGALFKFRRPKGHPPREITPELWEKLHAAIVSGRLNYETGEIAGEGQAAS